MILEIDTANFDLSSDWNTCHLRVNFLLITYEDGSKIPNI